MNRTIGLVGLLATALWAAGIGVEYVNPGEKSSAHWLGELLIWLGFVGFAVLIVGMLRSGAAGRGAFAKVALGVWAFGHLSIAIGGVVEYLTGDADNLFYPVGGLAQIVGGIASAVVVARAGVLTGWRRWTPLAWLVTYLGVFATFFGQTAEMTALTLAPFVLWLAAIAVTSVGFATADPARIREAATA
ncbi:hypothetical protein [Sphaerisporangium dianthi]|uniref:Uncharacterized protein n=1 Tax=Sphaerisporangium dianthi TaxID=1436120 RepID=A0ABV9CAQ3_9ACTN